MSKTVSRAKSGARKARVAKPSSKTKPNAGAQAKAKTPTAKRRSRAEKPPEFQLPPPDSDIQ